MSNEQPRLIKYAQVFWTPSDIKELRPEWTDEQCEEFIARIEERITDRMIQVGWQVIEQELQ
jgi:hypothetical protein